MQDMNIRRVRTSTVVSLPHAVERRRSTVGTTVLVDVLPDSVVHLVLTDHVRACLREHWQPGMAASSVRHAARYVLGRSHTVDSSSAYAATYAMPLRLFPRAGAICFGEGAPVLAEDRP
jgi:hypothetical protein